MLLRHIIITHNKDILGGEPRIDETHIGIRLVATRVVNSGQSPAYVADQLNVPLAGVYKALSCYYTHVDGMHALEADNEAAFEDIEGHQ